MRSKAGTSGRCRGAMIRRTPSAGDARPNILLIASVCLCLALMLAQCTVSSTPPPAALAVTPTAHTSRQPTVHPTDQPSARAGMTGSRSRIDDALEDGRHRKPAGQTPGATALQGRDEVRALLEEHAMPRAGGARVLSPDEVLAELRRLKEQRMDTPAATPAAPPTQ